MMSPKVVKYFDTYTTYRHDHAQIEAFSPYILRYLLVKWVNE